MSRFVDYLVRDGRRIPRRESCDSCNKSFHFLNAPPSRGFDVGSIVSEEGQSPIDTGGVDVCMKDTTGGIMLSLSGGTREVPQAFEPRVSKR